MCPISWMALPTVLLDVGLVLIPEMAHRAQKRIGGARTQGAQGSLFGHLGQILQLLDIALFSPSLGDIRENLVHLS